MVNSIKRCTSVSPVTFTEDIFGDVYVNLDGSKPMFGILTAPNVLASDPQNTSANALTRKDYVDGQDNLRPVKSYVDDQDNLRVAKIGDSMSGALTAGPARMFGRADAGFTNEALFSNKDAPEGSVGWAANNLGDLSAIAAAGRTFYVWNKNPAGGHDQRLSVTPSGVNVIGALTVAGTGTFGDAVTLAPTADNLALILRAPNHATPYLAWYHGIDLGAHMQVNFTAGTWEHFLAPDWSIRWWVNNAHLMTLSSAGLVIVKKINCSYNPIDGSWATANVIAQSDGAHGSRVAIRHGGAVGQWRMHNGVGAMEAITSDALGYVPVRGGVYTNASALSTKKDVRPLREGGDAIDARIAPLPSDADTVEVPNIMALTPIVYRHAVEPQCVIVDDNGEQTGVEPEPIDTVRGKEGRREHIGLIADDVQHVIPSAVVHDGDGKVVGIDYAQVTVALLDHVQQLTDEFAELGERLESLEKGTP